VFNDGFYGFSCGKKPSEKLCIKQHAILDVRKVSPRDRDTAPETKGGNISVGTP